MLTRYGMEGTLIYQLGRALRGMGRPVVEIDFKPTFTHEQLLRKMESAKRNFVAEARQRWRLRRRPRQFSRSSMAHRFAEQLARAAKNCRIPLLRPRPLAEAIFHRGRGGRGSELDEFFMLHQMPGVFCAGE